MSRIKVARDNYFFKKVHTKHMSKLSHGKRLGSPSQFIHQQANKHRETGFFGAAQKFMFGSL